MSEALSVSVTGLRKVQILRPSALASVVTGDGEEAFELLVERWRMLAFDMYAAVRHAQRDREGSSVSARLVSLCQASDVAQTLVEEIAALRVAALVDLSDEVTAGVAV
jgi:hypothetical protein